MRCTIGWLLALGVVAGMAGPLPAGNPSAEAQPKPQLAEAMTEAAASAAAALASGERVEVVSLRGETRDVFALPSGRFEMVQHQRPVRARKDGRWLPVDPTLTRLPDGGLAPAVSSVDIRLSGGGAEPFVQMSRAGQGVGLGWPARLPAPSVDGDAATYPEVLPGVDLRVRADVDGFAHLLVVKTPQAARDPALARLRLWLDAPRLVVTADADGVLTARDAASGGAGLYLGRSREPVVGIRQQPHQGGSNAHLRFRHWRDHLRSRGRNTAMGQLTSVPDRDGVDPK